MSSSKSFEAESTSAHRAKAHHQDKANTQERCASLVKELMSRYQWALISVELLAARVCERFTALNGKIPLSKIAIQEYTLVLYEACRQEDELSRKERAYTELYRYIYHVAKKKRPEVGEDLAQQAILLVHEQFESCREPGAFLQFALFKLRQAETQWLRLEAKAALSDVEMPLSQIQTREQTISPQAITLENEQVKVLLQALARLSDERKRDAIVLKYFMGLSDEEIAKQLHLTANHVRVLRNRGIQQLKQDANLKRYFLDLE